MQTLELAPPHAYDLAADTAELQELHLGYVMLDAAVRDAQLYDAAPAEEEPTIVVGVGLDWSNVLTGKPQQVEERSEWWRPAPMTASEAKACMDAVIKRQEVARENLLTGLVALTGKPVTVSALREMMPEHFTQESFNNDPSVVPTKEPRKISGNLLGVDWGSDATESIPVAIVVGPDDQGVLTLWRIPFFDDSKRVAVTIREFDSLKD